MKRNYWTMFFFLSACVLFFNLNLNAGENDTYYVKYKMKKGTELNYTVTSKMEMIQEVMGSEQEMESTLTAKVYLSSEGADSNGNFTYIMVYESFVTEVYNAMMDSTITDPKGIVGKRIKKVVMPNGDQIESIELDTLDLGVLGRGGGFSSEQEFLPNLPSQALKMGETVSMNDIDSTHSNGGTIIRNGDFEFTLIGKESMLGYDCLKIEMKGTVALEGDGKFGAMQFFIEGDGEVASTIFFAAKEGILVSQESLIDLEMTIAVTGQQNMTIPMTQSIKSTLTLEK